MAYQPVVGQNDYSTNVQHNIQTAVRTVCKGKQEHFNGEKNKLTKSINSWADLQK